MITLQIISSFGIILIILVAVFLILRFTDNDINRYVSGRLRHPVFAYLIEGFTNASVITVTLLYIILLD